MKTKGFVGFLGAPVSMALLGVSVVQGQAHDTPAPPEFKPVRDYIEEKIARGVAPSVSVAVVKNDQVIWAEAFGFANIERQRKATSDSIYKIASVTKPMTATGIMLLADRGLLDVDKPANDYLTAAKLRAYAGDSNGITIRRLANHTAGLPVHDDLYYDGSQPLSPDECVRRFAFAAWKPGSHYQYSNIGYGVLGLIAQTVSKKSWPEFLRQNVFVPLGMTRTFTDGGKRIQEETTSQYTYDIAGHFVRVSPYETSHPAAGGVWSTVNDLARFVRMHLHGGVLDNVRFLKKESADAMQHSTPEVANLGENHGIGWGTDTFMGHHSFYHEGGAPGVAAMVRAYPDDRAATIVLTNYYGAMAQELTKRLARVLFADARETEAGAQKPSPDTQTAVLTGRWEGRLVHFDRDIPVRAVISETGAVEIRFGVMPPFKLERVQLDGNSLTGSTQGILLEQAAFHGESVLEFQLRRENDRLLGLCDAYAKGYFEHAYWMELVSTDRSLGNR
jgi:CubicO group peptidase (beta-lactamase class C family)